MNSSKVKVLGIVGSPRRNGNTEILVDEVLNGAKNAGAIIEKIILSEKNIHPCDACNTCHKTNKCVHEDDMIEIAEKMKASQVWVLGTPVYWWGPTAQFKIFMDRWYGAKPAYDLQFKGKKIIITVPLGGGEAQYARHTVGILNDVINYLNMELFETIIALGVNRRGSVKDKLNLIQKARNSGQQVIEKY